MTTSYTTNYGFPKAEPDVDTDWPEQINAAVDAIDLEIAGIGEEATSANVTPDDPLPVPTVARLAAGRASAAAPADVSADGDAVAAWRLRNGAEAVVVTAAGALVGGDAANGLDVDVTRLPAITGNVTADTELPAAAALADGAANPTAPTVGAGISTFNGATWDRARGDTTYGLDVDVTRMASLPAGTNKIGQTDFTTRTLTWVTGTCASSGDNSIVAAPGAGVKIVVKHFITQNETTTPTTIILRDGTTSKIRVYAKNQGDGLTMNFENGSEWRLTNNTALQINLSGANTCGYTFGYWTE